MTTSRRSTSWASVVANGIVDEPDAGLLAATTTTTATATATDTAKAASQWPMLTQKPKSRKAAKSATVTVPIPDRILANATAAQSAALTPPSTPNRLQKISEFRRAIRNVLPRQPSPSPDQRDPRSSSQGAGGAGGGGVGSRTRRHHHESRTLNSCQVQPRPMMKPLIAGYGNVMHAENRMLSGYYPAMPLSSEQPTCSQSAEPSNLMFEWDQAQTFGPDLREDEDNQRASRASVSPRARSRCQVSLSDAQNVETQWQPVCESRRVWEPLQLNGRHQDPSHPRPPPPPGFEHVVTGKRSVSSRARQLMGERVKMGPHKDYPTPLPMVMPERELREQQHYIAQHDTHLSGRLAQLRVTSGATGDGYYVRPVDKLMPKVTKVLVPPKYQSSFHPDVSYWELLRRNREKDEPLAADLSEQADKLMRNDPAESNQTETYINFSSECTFKTEVAFAPLDQLRQAKSFLQFADCSKDKKDIDTDDNNNDPTGLSASPKNAFN